MKITKLAYYITTAVGLLCAVLAGSQSVNVAKLVAEYDKYKMVLSDGGVGTEAALIMIDTYRKLWDGNLVYYILGAFIFLLMSEVIKKKYGN